MNSPCTEEPDKYRGALKNALVPLTNQTERMIAFLGVLGRFLCADGYGIPIVVGGSAVEIYTRGLYTSQDIDLKADMAATLRILDAMGFVNQGRNLMYSEEFDLLVDWQGADLEEGPDARERSLVVTSADGTPMLRLINIADLVIDRLEAYKFGKDLDSLAWARVLLTLAEQNHLPLNEELLRERAASTDVTDVLEEIWNSESPSNNCAP